MGLEGTIADVDERAINAVVAVKADVRDRVV
jgi:hypothetical protein